MNSLREQVERLENAKTKITTALAEKGIDVSNNFILDDCDNLIRTIKVGTQSNEVTAKKENVLVGVTTITSDSNDAIVQGTMPNNGAVSQNLNCGGSYTIPKGYHNGSGKITANSLASQTSGTATASQILSGKTAWVNGNQISGGMVDRAACTTSINCGGSYTIPQGYHNGGGVISANSLSSQTSATASASQILSGQTAWVNGSKITGSMANQGTQTKTITPSGSTQTYTIPAGYHNGSGKVTVPAVTQWKSYSATLTSSSSTRTFQGLNTWDPSQNLYYVTISNIGFTPICATAICAKEGGQPSAAASDNWGLHYSYRYSSTGYSGYLYWFKKEMSSSQIILPCWVANAPTHVQVYGYV